MQTLVPGLLDMVMGGFPLLAWNSSWTSHWLATPIISVPSLPQHILLAGQILGGRFCVWVGVPIPPFDIWFQEMAGSGSVCAIARRLRFLGVIDSWEFPCTSFLAHPREAPDPVVFPSMLSLHHPVPDPSCSGPQLLPGHPSATTLNPRI